MAGEAGSSLEQKSVGLGTLTTLAGTLHGSSQPGGNSACVGPDAVTRVMHPVLEGMD